VAAGEPNRAVAIATPNAGLAFAAIRLGVAAGDPRFRTTRFIDLPANATSLDDIVASGAEFAVVSCDLARAFTGQSGPALLEREDRDWRLIVAPPAHHRVFNVRTARFRTIFLQCK
jgi:hypothetical protein